mgnify:FL=1
MLRELKTRLILSLPPMPAIWHHRFGILME